MHDSDPASSSSRPNSAQPSPVGPASPGLPGTPLIFKSMSSLGMPLQPSNSAAGLLHASLQQSPAPAGPSHLKGIPEGQPGVPSTEALADQTAGPAQVYFLLHAMRRAMAQYHISLSDPAGSFSADQEVDQVLARFLPLQGLGWQPKHCHIGMCCQGWRIF